MSTKEAYEKIINSIGEIYGESEAASIAAIVLEDAFGVTRFQISDERMLKENEANQLEEIISRLFKNEPVQYVLGETQFFGLKFFVNPSVLIPRQETEELVAWVLETKGDKLRVLDIGTGSGCIPIALKNKKPNWEIHALDVSESALDIAKKNAALNHTKIHFHQLDILNEQLWVELRQFDILISNPPYITEKEKSLMPAHVLEYEPHLALFATDGDAQQFVKKITAFAKKKLRKGGLLFFETNEFYGEDSKKVMEDMGVESVELRKDLNGKDRMLRGEV